MVLINKHLITNIIFFTLTEKKLKLYWPTNSSNVYLNDFTNMFKGLANITEVHLEHMF